MKYRILMILVVAYCLTLAPGSGLAIEGLRGSTWGDLRWDLPDEGSDDLILRGWIRQGIDWKRWGNTLLNTYATVRYATDTRSFDWNNSVGPGIGIGLDTHQWGIGATLGIEYLWDRLYESDRTERKTVVYMTWYSSWDLKD